MSRRSALSTETVENYLKAIAALAERDPSGPVAPGGVAEALGVTPGTVTAMAKRLSAAGLIRYERYGGLLLTAKGRRQAMAVLRRHRIVETFLVETLGLDWTEVHDEAERLEHALSDVVLDRLDGFLRRPITDPHGDPIPRPDGSLGASAAQPLAALEAGTAGRIARLLDQSAAFLRFAARHGLRPGATLTLLTVEDAADAITVRAGSHGPVTVSSSVARRILIEPSPARLTRRRR
jgi:DtxR family Mn-dependent transcriptional regulator